MKVTVGGDRGFLAVAHHGHIQEALWLYQRDAHLYRISGRGLVAAFSFLPLAAMARIAATRRPSFLS
jgi:hypothetical protein